MSSDWYDTNAASVAARYEAIDAAALHHWLPELLPTAPAAVLDVGAGSGRDAAWLASLGHEVVAAEPSAAMRGEAARLHSDPRIRWLDDALPDLDGVLRSGLAFDVVLLSAVWQQVHPSNRARAFRKLASVLKPGGVLAITLRHGPAPEGRGMHPVSLREVEDLARDHGFALMRSEPAADMQGRPEVSWTRVALRLPDDGTGALPLLRHVILNDQKASTYKLGLLRALCRGADGAAGLAQDEDNGFVSLPLGLVALNWLRLYLPLVAARLPQAPKTRGQTASASPVLAFRHCSAAQAQLWQTCGLACALAGMPRGLSILRWAKPPERLPSCPPAS